MGLRGCDAPVVEWRSAFACKPARLPHSTTAGGSTQSLFKGGVSATAHKGGVASIEEVDCSPMAARLGMLASAWHFESPTHRQKTDDFRVVRFFCAVW